MTGIAPGDDYVRALNAERSITARYAGQFAAMHRSMDEAFVPRIKPASKRVAYLCQMLEMVQCQLAMAQIQANATGLDPGESPPDAEDEP